MYQFIETIRIEKGNACNLFYHNRRLNEVRRYFRPECAPLQLEDYLHLSADMNGVKCRVVYTEEGITEVSYSLYEMRLVRSLRMVCSDTIDYSFKSTDRRKLNSLFQIRQDKDDILIVKNGLLTDTSIANIALYDGNDWYTPLHPLLKGTKRAELLDKGVLKEKEIKNIIAEVTFGNVYSLRNLNDLGYEEQTWYQKDKNIKRYILLKNKDHKNCCQASALIVGICF